MITLKEITEKIKLSVRCGESRLQSETTGVYIGDLLSDVIANGKAGNVWVTMQVHVNIVAVAVLKELAAIIIVQNREPSEDTLKKAVEENVPIFVSKLSAYQLAGKLYNLGIGL
jgi:hypothetical protein